MREVILPGLGRSTSALGFGMSRIIGGVGRRQSLRLLETAFDSGITHFDVAPCYGSGGAEAVLGTFLGKHGDSVTVTTKFGIPRPAASMTHLTENVRALLRPVLNRLPAIKAKLVSSATMLDMNSRSTRLFSAELMSESIKTSLRALRCERVDVLLMHEAELHHMSEEMLFALQRLVTEGLIGSWGVGSGRDKIDRIVRCSPIRPPILQFEWSVLSNVEPEYTHAFVITHQSLSSALGTLRAVLSNAARRRAWSAVIDADLGNDAVLSSVLLGAAIESNLKGITLFSSNRQERIRENSAAMFGNSRTAARKLIELIRINRQIITDSALGFSG